MSSQDKKKPFVDELFEDLEKQYKSPDPKTIAGKVESFERLLNGALLPFFGVNAFFIGSLVYYSQTRSILMPAGLSLVLMAGWLVFFPRAARATAWLHIGALAAILLMLLLAIPNPLAALAFGLAVTAGLTFSVIRGLVPEKATLVYIVYLPIMATTEISQETRLVFELLTLVPMALLFIGFRFHIASLATLVGAVLTGWLELKKVGQGDLSLVIFMGGFVVAAAVYEWRIPRTEVSSLREFLGYGLTMLLTFVATITLLDPAEPFTWWLWAFATAVYHCLKMIIERLAYPTRAGWVAVAFWFCLWEHTPDMPWFGKVNGTLALAAALHLMANVVGGRLLATLALLIASGAAFSVLFESYRAVSVQVIGSCLLSVAFLLIASLTRPDPEDLPWWRGFLRAEHNEQFRRFCLGTLAQLLRIPFMVTLFMWIRTGFTWLKYIKGNADPFSLADLTFAAAHVLAALVLSNQLTLLLVPKEPPAGLVSLIVAPVWVLWGIGLVLAGCRRKLLYYRLLGTVFMTYPLFMELTIVRSEDTLVLALLALIMGFGMWMAGMLVRRLSLSNIPGTVSSNKSVSNGQSDQ